MAELKYSPSFTHWVLKYGLCLQVTYSNTVAITLHLLLTIDKISSKSQFPQVTLTGKAASAKMVRHRGDGVEQGWLLGRECRGNSVSSASTEVIPLLLVTAPCLHRMLCWNSYCIYIHTLSHCRITSSHWHALRSTRKSIRLWLHLALGWSLTR